MNHPERQVAQLPRGGEDLQNQMCGARDGRAVLTEEAPTGRPRRVAQQLRCAQPEHPLGAGVMEEHGGVGAVEQHPVVERLDERTVGTPAPLQRGKGQAWSFRDTGRRSLGRLHVFRILGSPYRVLTRPARLRLKVEIGSKTCPGNPAPEILLE